MTSSFSMTNRTKPCVVMIFNFHSVLIHLVLKPEYSGITRLMSWLDMPGFFMPSTHYCDVTMATMASQITSLTIVYSTVYSDADQRKHQSSPSLAFVWRIHRWPVNSPHKWPITRKIFPIDDVFMPSATWYWWWTNGSIFRVIGPLWGEFTGHRWIPLTKASDAQLWCFLCSAPEKNDCTNNRYAGD